MGKFKQPGIYIAFASLMFVAIGFQNCSKTNFVQTPDGASLKTEDMMSSGQIDQMADGGIIPDIQPPQQDDPPVSNPPVVTDPPVVSNPPPVVAEPPVVVTPLPESPEVPDKPGNKPPVKEVPPVVSNPPEKDDEEEASASGDLVECDMNRPKSKIIFSLALGIGSNASATRVCMSENACLKIINAYASARDCSMAVGPAKSAASGQCTAIFPGSRGVCKKAQVLSDAQVQDLLSKMAAAK